MSIAADKAQPLLSAGATDIAEKEKRDRIRAYFSGQFHEERRKWLRVRQIAQGALILLGAALWVATIFMSLHEAADFYEPEREHASLREVIVIVGGLFITGGLMIVIARWPNLWRRVLRNPARIYFWLLLFPLMMVLAWALKHEFGFSDIWQRAVMGIAGIFFLLGFFFHAKEPPPEEEMERALDLWLEEDIKRHLDNVLPLSRALSSGQTSEMLLLKTFPDTALASDIPVAGRIGHDKRPRINPAGFCVFVLYPEMAFSLEGATDLVTGDLPYAHLREFAYTDIATLRMSTQNATHARKADGMKIMRNLARAATRPRARQKDVFAVSMNGGESLALLLRDNGYVATWPEEMAPLNDQVQVRHVWTRLSERRQNALTRRAAEASAAAG